MKFKIGDIVQIKANLSSDQELDSLIGKKGKIIYKDDSDRFPYFVHIFDISENSYEDYMYFHSGKYTIMFDEEELAPCKPKLKKFLEEFKQNAK